MYYYCTVYFSFYNQMTMIGKLMLAFALSIQLLFSCTQGNHPEHYKPSLYPDRIMLNIPGDPATTRAITWRTSAKIKHSLVQYALADCFVPESNKIQSVKGRITNTEKGVYPYINHVGILKGLNPESTYVYRVGDGDKWSEWIQFKTSSSGHKPFSFLYFGDLQNNIRSDCSRLIRQAYNHFPNSDFFMFIGDIVGWPTNLNWQEFYDTGRWIFSEKPSLAVRGNHEVLDLGIYRKFSEHWNQFFYHPQNGPEGLKNIMYYVDYNGVRIISVDSYSIIYYDKYDKQITDWLIQVLENNPNRWTIVMSHYPVYSCTPGRDQKHLKETYLPLLEKYKVDLVLQGHDHVYCRGQNKQKDGGSGFSPVFVISVAGPKANKIIPVNWAQRSGNKMQLYQHIAVKEDSLSYTAWTINGKLFDDFTLVKNRPEHFTLIESF